MRIFGTNHYNDPYEPHHFFNGTKWGFLMYHYPGSPTVQPPFFFKGWFPSSTIVLVGVHHLPKRNHRFYNGG